MKRLELNPGGHHDASSSSTAASEQSSQILETSDRRKRSSPGDEEESLKPYECRFCPMKFTKSQALGGHMNRHRQEREREQLMNARQLIMQQEFSSIMMPGQHGPSALPNINHAHMQRSASEGSLRDGTRISAPPPGTSAYKGSLQSNAYNSSLGPPNLSWNLGSMLGSTQNSASTSSLDGMLPMFQARHAYGFSPFNNNTSSYTMQKPPNGPLGNHDMMISLPYEKAMQESIFPFESNPHAGQGSSSLQSLRQQNQSEEGGILAGTADGSPHIMSSDKSLIHHGTNDVKRTHQFSHTLSSQPKASQQTNTATISSCFHFYSYPPADGAKSSIPCMPNPSLDFNEGSTSHLDGLPWLLGNSKTVPTTSSLSPPNDEYHHNLSAPEPKMNDASLTGAGGEQLKTMRWELALPSPDNEAGTRIRDLTPVTGRISTLQFGVDYAHGTSEIEGANSQESKVSR